MRAAVRESIVFSHSTVSFLLLFSPLLQVALRWIIQRNATFTTSASTLAYFSEDLDLFDFTLTPAEMETLDAK